MKEKRHNLQIQHQYTGYFHTYNNNTKTPQATHLHMIKNQYRKNYRLKPGEVVNQTYFFIGKT